MEAKRLEVRGIVAALVLALIARILFAHLLGTLVTRDPVVVDDLSALCQYALWFGLTVLVMRPAGVRTAAVIGDGPSWAVVAPGLLLACLLLAFTYGENALEAWLVARVSPAFAWHYWGFHAIPYVLTVSPPGYLLLWLVQCGAAPLVEEFVFRGVLERALRVRFGAGGAMLWVAFGFTLLHFSRHYYLSTFVFSVAMSLLYARYRSLWANVAAHALFNAVAWLIQYDTGFHWLRSPDSLASVGTWWPEWVMLLVSLPLLAAFVRRSLPAVATEGDVAN